MEKFDLLEYNKALASSSYTPGGGSATCLIASICLSTVIKSIRISSNRKSFDKYEESFKQKVLEIISYLETSVQTMFELEQKDQEAFAFYMDCFRNDKERLNEAIENSFNVPFDTYKIIDNCLSKIEFCKPMVVSSIISDYNIGVVILVSCLDSCLETMKLNINENDKLEKIYNDLVKERQEKYGN